VEKDSLHAYTKQCTESYLCIFLFQIIIHIQIVTEIEEIGWVMEGTACAEDYTFFCQGKKLSIRDRICLYIREKYQQLRELRLLVTGCYILR
jgi:hypothetical protein